MIMTSWFLLAEDSELIVLWSIYNRTLVSSDRIRNCQECADGIPQHSVIKIQSLEAVLSLSIHWLWISVEDGAKVMIYGMCQSDFFALFTGVWSALWLERLPSDVDGAVTVQNYKLMTICIQIRLRASRLSGVEANTQMIWKTHGFYCRC